LFKISRSFTALALVLVFAAAAQAQAPRAFAFRATNYNVEVILRPEDQTLTAQAKVDFVADQVSKTLVVELHSDLKISSVHVPGGKPLEFDRDKNNQLLVDVGLPEVQSPGKQVTLVFEYGGPISNEDDSPTKGVRFGSIDKTSAYLLLPARWFPLTNYPSNRYTGTFKLVVPDTFAVVGTGKADSPVMMPPLGKGMAGQAAYTFHCDHAGPVGTFVAGSLQLTPAHAEGIEVSVYTPPAQAATATTYANSLAHIILYLSDAFGPMQDEPSWTIAQMPEGSLQGFSAPGLLLLSARQWNAKGNDRLLSQLAAQQWWGDSVLPATPSDVWVTDGLSRYAEAMYAEQSNGVAGLHKALEDFAVGALMFEETSPISQSARLDPYSNEYRSVVADKGALIFHMLRTQLGDDAFTALLRDFYKKSEGKTATIAEFEKMAAAKAPPPAKGQPPLNLTAFFTQWLNSTGIPEFKIEYIVYRTPKGFKVVGKIHQDLDTFRMPVEVKVDTEGNPEYKKIMVTGTTSEFVIDTFGRPRPNGITIDPNNNLLKSSARLRVRAAIARGEGLAELGKYYEAIKEYQHALDIAPSSALAHFRMGEAMFYQKNYQSAANAFRAALGGDQDPKWVEVWSHIYIGRIYDLLDQRARAVNEYQLAQRTNDDTAGAQEQITRYMQKPYTENASADTTATPVDSTPTKPSSAAGSSSTGGAAAGDATADNKPVLKKRPPQPD
jgi:aminopeptidase N